MPIGPDGPTSPSVMTAAMTSKAMTSKAVTSKAVVEMMAAAETERYAGPISVVAGTIAVRVVGIVTIAVVAANISPRSIAAATIVAHQMNGFDILVGQSCR